MINRQRLAAIGCALMVLLSLAAGAPSLRAAEGTTRAATPPAEITLESLLQEMMDRNALARWPDPPYTCKQASSWDRRSVGDSLSIHNGAGPWWGEGDERVYVDGEVFPSHFGTGTEDYDGYSYGDQGTFFESPFHAEPRWEGEELRTGQHVLTAEIVGSNPAATPRHMLGLDYLRLEPK